MKTTEERGKLAVEHAKNRKAKAQAQYLEQQEEREAKRKLQADNLAAGRTNYPHGTPTPETHNRMNDAMLAAELAKIDKEFEL